MNIPVKSCLLGVVIISIGFIFNDIKVDAIHTEEGLELLFRQRTNSDWENVWHSETHSRCRYKLVRQLYWACENDIYRLTRRNRKRTDESFTKRNRRNFTEKLYITTHSSFLPIWLKADLAQTLLRTRRSNDHSITTECCTKTGCTWEEYAEYCPSNKRRNHF